jgi:hypothetical protein
MCRESLAQRAVDVAVQPPAPPLVALLPHARQDPVETTGDLVGRGEQILGMPTSPGPLSQLLGHLLP